MTWSELHPGIRAALLAAGILVALLILWSFVVAPLRARQASLSAQVDGAEGSLEQMERQIEAVPPASQAELTAWQNSRDALFGQLGPESDLPLFIETLVRLSEAEGVEAYINTAGASDVGGQNGLVSQTEQVLGTIPGVRRVPLMVSAFGEHQAISGFVSQVGRLGFVTEVDAVRLQRSFPEIAAQIVVVVYFRADSAAGGVPAGAGNRPGAQPMGAQGGGGND